MQSTVIEEDKELIVLAHQIVEARNEGRTHIIVKEFELHPYLTVEEYTDILQELKNKLDEELDQLEFMKE